MTALTHLVSFVLHADQHLQAMIAHYGTLTYAILALVIFCETGLVVTPFLPGDSLLFAAGALASAGSLEVAWVLGALYVAAVLGDNVNYWVGRKVGPMVFRQEKGLFFNRAYLMRTEAFYERHGGKALILARFAPILRTFAPFVAGIGRMRYLRFLLISMLGGALWIGLFVLGGYFFGAMPVVKKHFELVILGVIAVSLLPSAFELWRHRQQPA